MYIYPITQHISTPFLFFECNYFVDNPPCPHLCNYVEMKDRHVLSLNHSYVGVVTLICGGIE